MIFSLYDKDENGLDYFEFIDILSASKEEVFAPGKGNERGDEVDTEKAGGHI